MNTLKSEMAAGSTTYCLSNVTFPARSDFRSASAERSGPPGHRDAGDREGGIVERAQFRVFLLPETKRPPGVRRGLVLVDAGMHVGDARSPGERVAVLEHVSVHAAELLEGLLRRPRGMG